MTPAMGYRRKGRRRSGTSIATTTWVKIPIVALDLRRVLPAEEDQEHPDPAEFLTRFPQVAARSAACSRSTSWSDRERSRPRSRFVIDQRDGDAADATFPEAGRDDRRLRARGRTGPRGVRRGLPGQGARAGRPASGAQGFAARLARAADPGAVAAHPYRAGALAPDRPGERAAPAVHALLRADHPVAGAGRPPGSNRRLRAPFWPRRSIGSSAGGELPAGNSAGRLELARRSYSRAIAWWCAG